MTEVDVRRSPSGPKKLVASLVVLVAIAFLLLGFVGLLQSETTQGLLVAGYVLLGGGALLVRLSWRLYRGVPGLHALSRGRTPDQARALARELARRQWFAAAIFLVALTVAYLLVALLLTTGEAALGAASVAAITAAALGLLSWWQARSDDAGSG